MEAGSHPIQLSAQMCVVTRSMEGTTWLARKSCPSCAAQGDDWMPVRRLPAPGFRKTLQSGPTQCRGKRRVSRGGLIRVAGIQSQTGSHQAVVCFVAQTEA